MEGGSDGGGYWDVLFVLLFGCIGFGWFLFFIFLGMNHCLSLFLFLFLFSFINKFFQTPNIIPDSLVRIIPPIPNNRPKIPRKLDRISQVQQIRTDSLPNLRIFTIHFPSQNRIELRMRTIN